MAEPTEAAAAAPTAAEVAAAPAAAAAPETGLVAAPAAEGGAAATDPKTGEGEAAAAAGQGAETGQAAEGGASTEAGAAKEGEGAETAAGAPEQYAAFTMPEGFELTGDLLDSLTSYAKAHNHTQEQAQALVDLGVQQAQALMDRFNLGHAHERPVLFKDHWASEWSKQTAADPELGGDKLGATVGLAQRVFATFATPALGKFLTDTGIAHHPEMIRLLHAVGKAVSEDTLVTANGGQAGLTGLAKTDEERAAKLFPSMAK